ncbi:MAG: c-type cytochrome [Deinococcus sp.]
MTLLPLLLLAALLLAALLAVLAPLRRAELPDPEGPQREQLEAERDALFAGLRGLHAGEGDPERRPELEGRAARVLRALDAIPPAPAKGPAGRGGSWLWAGLAASALLTLVGAFSFIPRWQLGGLPTAEARTVQAALRLPGLAGRARASGSVADELAWGKASFDAGQYDQAASAYAAALRQNPRQPEALRRLGIILLTRGDAQGGGQAAPATKLNDQAFLLIRTAAQLAPREPESQLLLGFALSRYGQDQPALAALERYRTLNPGGRDADDLITAIRARLNEADPGARVYAANCASCHGAAGGGGIGPALRGAGLSRGALQAVTLHGKGSMPAFPKLKANELEALLTLLEGWQK